MGRVLIMKKSIPEKVQYERISIPDETEWQHIYYHPEPIVTVLDNLEHVKAWEATIPGCRIEFFENDAHRAGFMSRGIKAKIFYPDDFQEHMAEPLAKMHTEFWMNKLDTLLYGLYPFNSYNKPRHYLMTDINGILSRIYWDTDYSQYTPKEWAEMLNTMMDFVENNVIKKKDELESFELRLKEVLHSKTYITH